MKEQVIELAKQAGMADAIINAPMSGADTMTLYRKKPVVIEAVQWDGSWDAKLAIEARWPELRTTHLESHPPSKTIRRWGIGTLEGYHQVGIGDYIIKGVKGEFYPCKPDIFAMTYEVAE